MRDLHSRIGYELDSRQVVRICAPDPNNLSMSSCKGLKGSYSNMHGVRNTLEKYLMVSPNMRDWIRNIISL